MILIVFIVLKVFFFAELKLSLYALMFWPVFSLVIMINFVLIKKNVYQKLFHLAFHEARKTLSC